MPQGTRAQASLFIAAVALVALSLPALGDPATRPAARPVPDDPLPAGAVRRLGDRRFAVDGFRSGRVAVSPDGRHAAVADQSGASIWDVATGERTAVVRLDARPGRFPFGVAYLSPDTIAVGCADVPVPPRDSAVVLFLADPATGHIRSRLDLADAGRPINIVGDTRGGILGTTLALGLVASPDARRVAFHVGRQAILLYDAATGRRIADLTPPEVPNVRGFGMGMRTTDVGFGGGERGVTFDASGQARVFDAGTGARVGGRPFLADRAASVSADGRTLATIAGGSVHLFSLPDGAELDAPPRPADAARARPMHVAFAPTGGLLAVAWYGTPPRVQVLDTAVHPPRAVSDLVTRRSAPVGPVWSADARVLVVQPSPFGLTAFDVQTGRLLSPAATTADRATALAPDPDGRSVVIGDAAGCLRRWDLDTGRSLAEFAAGGDAPAGGYAGPVTDLRYVVDADGSVVLAVTRGREQWLSDRQTLAVRARLGGPLPATGVPDIYSPDGRRVAHVDNAGIVVADAKTDRPLVAPSDDEQGGRSTVGSERIRFSDDGRLLIVWTPRGFRVLDASTGRAGPAVADRGANTLCPSPDARFLAVGGNQQMALYSTTVPAGDAPQRLWTVPAATTSREPTFDHTGEWLAVPTLSDDPRTNGSALTVFETATGRPILTLPTAGMDSRIAFVPHRPMYVATEADGMAVVWDVRPLLHPDVGTRRTNDQLWADLADNDPAVAYRAGLVLADRGQLRVRSHPPAGTGDGWAAVVAELSSPDRAKREAAHKRLEGAGPAAADAIRRALASHPGGETEARLADLARLSVDDPPQPAAEGPSASDALRRQRVARLLDWTTDADAHGRRSSTTRP